MSSETNGDATLARDLAERFPGLQDNQYRALGALTIRPSIPWAAERAGISNVTLYRWLGRLSEGHKDEAFCEAFEVCRQMGGEAMVGKGLEMALAWDEGKPAAQRLMTEVMKAYGPEFRNQGVNVSTDQTVKRVILERE